MSKEKIKVAAVKFCMGADGGSEKFLQTILANLPKDKFEVDAYYTNAAPYIGSSWIHPDNNPHNLEYLKNNGVNLIPVHVDHKDVTQPHHPWIGTNFYKLFDESKYDVITSVRAGHREVPLCDLKKKPILEIVTLPGMADRQENIIKTIHISEYQKQTWVQAGGNESKAVVLPIVTEGLPQTSENFRNELSIKESDIVYGMHQRNDSGIYSPIALAAYKEIMNDNTWFIVLGGSDLYSEYAKQNVLKNFIQLPHTGDQKVISKFLNTLNIYTHSRKDGETMGNVLCEAMSKGLPIISHIAPAMGHKETIGDAGFICSSVEEYSNKMKELAFDKELYLKLSLNAVRRFQESYSKESVINKIIELFIEVSQTKMPDDLSDEEFWDNI